MNQIESKRSPIDDRFGSISMGGWGVMADGNGDLDKIFLINYKNKKVKRWI